MCIVRRALCLDRGSWHGRLCSSSSASRRHPALWHASRSRPLRPPSHVRAFPSRANCPPPSTASVRLPQNRWKSVRARLCRGDAVWRILQTASAACARLLRFVAFRLQGRALRRSRGKGRVLALANSLNDSPQHSLWPEVAASKTTARGRFFARETREFAFARPPRARRPQKSFKFVFHRFATSR